MANSVPGNTAAQTAPGRASAGPSPAAETGAGARNLLRLCRERPLLRWSLFGLAVPLALAAFVAAQNPAPYGRDGEFWRVWTMFSIVIGLPWLIVAAVTTALDRWTPLGRAPLLVLLAAGISASMLINRAVLSTLVPWIEPLVIGPLAFERPMAMVPVVPPDFAALLDTLRVNFIWILIWIGLVFLLDRGFGLRLFQTGRSRAAPVAAGMPPTARTEPPMESASGGRERFEPPVGFSSGLMERCRTVGRRLEDVRLLKAEDHYLRVFGDEANELVLFRMSDALRELESVDGAQVHRSYWVARRAVAGFVLENGQYELRLKDGAAIPVSRTFVERARAAGLLKNRLGM